MQCMMPKSQCAYVLDKTPVEQLQEGQAVKVNVPDLRIL